MIEQTRVFGNKMYKNKSFLAIITARAGSKRLPNKNIKILKDKPLVAWTIEAGLGSKYIDKTLVSTDSPKIKDISLEFGACVPFLRPDELAKDESSSIDTVLHAVEYMEKINNTFFDYAILLQPTSPFRNSNDIDEAIEFLFDKKADAVISVCEAEHNPLWSNTLNSTKSMKNFLDKKYINKRGQDLDKYYRLNGAIYVCDVKILKKENTFFINDNIYAYEMLQSHSVDIDTKLDFDIAEVLSAKIKL